MKKKEKVDQTNKIETIRVDKIPFIYIIYIRSVI